MTHSSVTDDTGCRWVFCGVSSHSPWSVCVWGGFNIHYLSLPTLVVKEKGGKKDVSSLGVGPFPLNLLPCPIYRLTSPSSLALTFIALDWITTILFMGSSSSHKRPPHLPCNLCPTVVCGLPSYTSVGGKKNNCTSSPTSCIRSHGPKEIRCYKMW